MSALVASLHAQPDVAVLGVHPGFGPTTVDVDPATWSDALAVLCAAGATYFDFLTAYDELELGFAVVAHVSTPDAADHLLLRTRVSRDAAALASVADVYRGAGWHERETHEMFGIDFVGNDALDPLLLKADGAVHPLRKDSFLAARQDTPWPGEKEPTDSGGRSRRRLLPPGVPADEEPR
jgi:NADH-quinone oxidoreductase subunit C